MNPAHNSRHYVTIRPYHSNKIIGFSDLSHPLSNFKVKGQTDYVTTVLDHMTTQLSSIATAVVNPAS